MKAMAAALMPSQLAVGNSHCYSHFRPPASAHAAATPPSESPTTSFRRLRGAKLASACAPDAGSVRIPAGSKGIRSLAEPSRYFHDESSSSSSIGNVARKSTPLLFGRSRRYTKMEGGVGLVAEEATSSQRAPVRKAANKVVIMVDPVEAKRLAAAEMKAIQARAKLKRRKEIEAINGGWAVLGLTAGIVIDGYSGKSILLQLAGYLDALTALLTPLTPS